jgi:aldehyde:ferredoxin oxidoreductase
MRILSWTSLKLISQRMMYNSSLEKTFYCWNCTLKCQKLSFHLKTIVLTWLTSKVPTTWSDNAR